MAEIGAPLTERPITIPAPLTEPLREEPSPQPVEEPVPAGARSGR